MIFKQLIIFPLIIASGFGCSPEVVCAFMAKDLINAIKSIEILSFALAVFFLAVLYSLFQRLFFNRQLFYRLFLSLFFVGCSFLDCAFTRFRISF